MINEALIDFLCPSQLNFDDDALSYTDKRLILDSSGDSRGVAVFIQHGSLYYKVRFGRTPHHD